MENIITSIALQTISKIARYGEVVAGSSKEKQQVELIRVYIEDYVDDLSLEPVEVMLWDEHFCIIYINGEPYRCSIHPPYRGYIDIDTNRDNIIFIERLEDIYKVSSIMNGRVVLVNKIDDPNYIAIYSYLIRRFNPLAIVFADKLEALRRIVVVSEIISKYDYTLPPDIPSIHISNKTGVKLRNATRVRIIAKSELRPSYGYNVIAQINGSDTGSVYLTSHHDHWFNGVTDDIIGMSILLSLTQSRVLHTITRNGITLAFFSAEEGFPNPLLAFYWLVGSRKHVTVNASKILDEIPLVINIDVVYRNRIKFATSNLVARGLLLKLGIDVNNIEHDSMLYDSFVFTSLGIPSITIHSYDEVLNMGLYHSTLDDINVVDTNTLNNVFSIVRALIKNAHLVHTSSLNELLQLGIKTLANELVKRQTPLEVVLELHRVLKNISSCNAHTILKYLPTIHRIITTTYISKNVYRGLDVYEKTSYVTCQEDSIYLPIALELGNECYRNLLYNLESLTYILRC